MTDTDSGHSVGKSFKAGSPAEQKAAYDDWAETYEADLIRAGYRLPWVFAAVVAAHVDRGETPILDAGCGGGLQMEPLHLLGYHSVTGADFSEPMMKIARAKGLYEGFQRITLGETAPFATDHFSVTLCCGVITPGHAPASAFDEPVRVTKPGGKLIFSLRDDTQQEPEYPAKIAVMESSGAWRECFRTDAFHSIPIGEPDVKHRVHVCEVL